MIKKNNIKVFNYVAVACRILGEKNCAALGTVAEMLNLWLASLDGGLRIF